MELRLHSPHQTRQTFTVAIPILRIDADNNNGFELPDLTAEELSKQNPKKNNEDKFGESGRIIITSKSDSDGDGIPGFCGRAVDRFRCSWI